jgi:hypothetical protein
MKTDEKSHPSVLSLKFIATIAKNNRRSFDYVWRKERTKLRSG